MTKIKVILCKLPNGTNCKSKLFFFSMLISLATSAILENVIGGVTKILHSVKKSFLSLICFLKMNSI